MKRLYIFLVFFSVLPIMLLGQSGEVVRVDKQTDLTTVLSNSQYLLPEFTDGRIVYKNDKTAGGKMNYNFLLNAIQFIEGDKILALTDQNEVRVFTVGGKTLINVNNGFAEVIDQKGQIQLAVKKSIITNTPAKAGAYGVRSESSEIDSHSHVEGQVVGKITPTAEVKFTYKITYYIANNGKNQIANSKGFTKVFSSHKKEIEEYIKDKKIDFSKEDQVKQLFEYCIEL